MLVLKDIEFDGRIILLYLKQRDSTISNLNQVSIMFFWVNGVPENIDDKTDWQPVTI